MLARSSLSQNARRVAFRQCSKPINRRGMAAAASGSFQYATGDSNGVKFASRDLPGPTTTLAVVAKAGTRYQPLPGYSEGLQQFAFKSTEKRSALRVTREVELLGGDLYTYHTRENLVIGAKFLRDDLPYFAELLGEVISKTKYTNHELAEEVIPTIELARKSILGSPLELALNSAHGVAFHRGLGVPLHPTSSSPLTKYLDAKHLSAFSVAAYSKPNFAIVANGANQEEVSKWIGEFFKDSSDAYPEGLKLESQASKYFGGEERIAHDSGNAMVLGFSGSSSFTGSSYKPELPVLAALLGGESNIKWSPGFSLLSKAVSSFPQAHVATQNAGYSDAGLFYVSITGKASQVRSMSEEVVKTIKSVAAGQVSKEDFQKAVATARFKALEAGQDIDAGMEATGTGLVQAGKPLQIDEIAQGIASVTEDKLKQAAKSLLESKASVSTVGDLYLLPFAEEIGLQV
ncbi:MAG: ubiquinol-cytochrome c reductase core subunit 1 [Cirrosporium novae-zelandiae]|nr:MAG: ubiquinol-cytochrome c reductase core subunit 1 [Cirrosporium novae-zelandiae]